MREQTTPLMSAPTGLDRIPAVRAARAIHHARREYGHTTRSLLHTWHTTRHRTHPTTWTHPAWAHVIEFYAQLEDDRLTTADYYACAEGSCTVIWHNGRNIGGMGPAGCPCEHLDDPRGANPVRLTRV